MADSEIDTPIELRWPVDGMSYAGLAWGPENGPVVLALHGWLDNALSFEMLAQKLPECRVVAVDLAGHGRSDPRSPHATYHIWDDIPQLLGIIESSAPDGCILLGHSRGAMISTILGAVAPERIKAVMLLDALLPQPVEDAGFVRQFRQALDDRERYSNRQDRIFGCPAEYAERRARYGTPPEIARKLAERALTPVEGGYMLAGDPRLNAASHVKLNIGQEKAILGALSQPVLLFRFTEGLGGSARFAKFLDLAKSMTDRLEIADIATHHHGHMEDGPAEEIALHVMRILADAGDAAPVS